VDNGFKELWKKIVVFVDLMSGVNEGWGVVGSQEFGVFSS